jgi:hypothetical protein
LRVSIEIIVSSPAARSAEITGTVRRISSATATSAAPGRVLSPPMSMMSAVSAIALACASAAPRSANNPPSEKLSGVTFRMPMIRGRSRLSPAKAGRGAQSWSSISGAQSVAAITRPAWPRARTSTRSNQHQPPASRIAPAGRAASVIAIGRRYSMAPEWPMHPALARGEAQARSTGTRLPAGIATSP